MSPSTSRFRLLASTATRRTTLSVLFYSFVVITSLAVFLPLSPGVPAAGLDSSWHLAINQAVAQHLHFGREIMFTYGPYASICDRSYHPVTDRRMMLGCLLIGLSYLAGLFYLARGRRRYVLLLLFLVFATFPASEVIPFSYPFLLSVCVLKWIDSQESGKINPPGAALVLTAGVMLAALGLLPLIKGSFLLPASIAIAIPAAILLYRRRFRATLFLLLVPVLALAAFWKLAGQQFADFPAFVRLTMLLTSGYTEAMSTSWGNWPRAIGDGFELGYLAASALILVSVAQSNRMKPEIQRMLGCLCVLFLLIAFKLGFVRLDHLLVAYSTIAVFALIICLLYVDRYLIWSLCLTLLISVGVAMTKDDLPLTKRTIAEFKTGMHSDPGNRAQMLSSVSRTARSEFARTTYKSTWNTYRSAWDGLRARLEDGDTLPDRYKLAIETIRRENPLPSLNGQTDIYSYDQSVLIASGNHWDPRPILQGYSVYTPLLPQLDEAYLRSGRAPDWILFNLETVDGRLPSLDDGMSWPAIFDDYSFVSFDGRYTLLHRKPVAPLASDYDQVAERTCKLGETITLPNTTEPIFAEVRLSPTLLGKLLIVLFKPPQLRMDLTLESGKLQKYRVISNMMTTGFILSPLVHTTGEFAALASGNLSSSNGNRVQSFSITPSRGGSLFWSETYSLTLKNYHGSLEQK